MSRPQAPRSLQARLLGLLLALLCVVWLVTALMTWIDARHELDELLDSHLAQAAALLVVQQTRAEDDDVADVPMLHKYAPKVAFQVFHEGQLVMRSPNVDPKPLATINAGFSTVQRDDGSTWRVFATRGAADDVQVYVAEQDDSRSAILQAMLRSVLLPPLFALPLLALLIWWAVRRELKPLSQLSRQLKDRDGRQAQALAPLPLDQLPMDIHPVVEALNGLFQRLDQMLSAEQRFTADAAHELRTPIAAIRAQAQVAQGAGSNHAQREQALQATLAGCDRASRLVDQLLTLARLEADPGGAAAADPVRLVDLRSVAQRTAAELAPTALARQQDLALDAASTALVPGPEVLIGVLLRNLLDNALRYSPPGAQVTMRIDTQAGHTALSVEDSGAGLSEPEMARLGERFYRVTGQTLPGSGLGWSIVRRIAQATGAQLQLGGSERLGGLAVTVRWPTPLEP